jgi:lipopolysaccharide/colanic/teichoic acid biosynthesis glycosyltransferase
MEAAVSQRSPAAYASITGATYAPPSPAYRPRSERSSVADRQSALHIVAAADEEFHRQRRISADFYIPRERSELAARALNAVIAAITLVLLFPVLALVALLVRLTSSGPVFYSQVRVGLDRRWNDLSADSRRRHDYGGRPFKMWKFRTMRVDAEKDGRAVWAKKNDPRVTPIGGFLRLTRLDELPQLYNVLRGEMNIVGPRPERPTLFDELRNSIPEYPIRQRVKPGITGWAQINQAYDSCIDDVVNKVKFDLEYITRQCVIEDLRIMSMTIPVMIFRKGAH